MIPRPYNHHDDDEFDPYWKYQVDCGCELCEDFRESMIDSLEDDFWRDSSNEEWERGQDV